MKKTAEWKSENGKWKITDIEVKEKMSSAVVWDLTKRKRELVFVEHIRKGDSLLWGGWAAETRDSVVSQRRLPIYVHDQLLKMVR